MLGLPKSTEMSRQLPKKAIYAKFEMNTAAKNKIDADISKVTIVNEISPERVNLPAGDNVKNFYVLLVALKRKDFDEKTISALSKLIPQNILFILEYEGMSVLAVYRTKLLHTNWKPTSEHSVELKGLNLDNVWENIVAEVGDVNIGEGVTLDEQIALDEKRQKLKKQIADLQKKIRNEKQLNKQMQLNAELKKLKKELEDLSWIK